MKKMALAFLALGTGTSACFAAPPAQKAPDANNLPALAVKVSGFEDGQTISGKFTYCYPDRKTHTRPGGNVSPAVAWSGAPANTRSYVLLVVDPDVPASFDAANKPGQTIFTEAPRRNFYHWVLVDIPPNVQGLLEGKNSTGVTPGGKPYGSSDYGVNGLNDYPMGGYDGPCPPWNDERLHHYHFTVYALDIPSLKLPSPINGRTAEAAMAGHILARGDYVGTFSTNPIWSPKPAKKKR